MSIMNIYQIKDKKELLPIAKKLIKLGSTKNPIKRGYTYKTGEPDRGNYLKIFKVNDCETLEFLLQ